MTIVTALVAFAALVAVVYWVWLEEHCPGCFEGVTVDGGRCDCPCHRVALSGAGAER